MQRREFVRKAGVDLAAATGVTAIPSVARSLPQPAVKSPNQGLPTIKWRSASSVPKRLDTIYDTAVLFGLSTGK